MHKTHKTTARIYYADTDAGGVVYHANFLKYAEQARAELFREIGVELRKLQTVDRFGFVVKKCALDIMSPLFLDDTIRTETTITKIGNIKIFYKQSIFNEATNKLAASIESMVVGVGEDETDSTKLMPRYIPDAIAEKLKEYCE